jgi:hypothetical protein
MEAERPGELLGVEMDGQVFEGLQHEEEELGVERAPPKRAQIAGDRHQAGRVGLGTHQQRVKHLGVVEPCPRPIDAEEDGAQRLGVVGVDRVRGHLKVTQPLADLAREQAVRHRQLRVGEKPLDEHRRVEEHRRRHERWGVRKERRRRGGLARPEKTFAIEVEVQRPLARRRRDEERRGQGCQPLLTVHHPPRVGTLGRANLVAVKSHEVRRCFALPEQQRPDGIAAVHAVEQVELVGLGPTKPTLKPGHAQPPFAHGVEPRIERPRDRLGRRIEHGIEDVGRGAHP